MGLVQGGGVECIFCEIVAGRSPAQVVWQDEEVLAFMDINPVTDGHVLIIPTAHSVGLDDIDAGTAGLMMQVAQRVATALKDGEVHCEGVNLFFADGQAAFQEVFHSHLHVFPRYAGDGFTIDAPWQGRSPESLARSAAAIRHALEVASSSEAGASSQPSVTA